MPLEEHDPVLFDLIEKEKHRQWSGMELIASENLTSKAVMTCLGSCLTNKYAEGYPGKRYYGGNEIVDQVEILCQERALAAYGLNPAEWGVNVQVRHHFHAISENACISDTPTFYVCLPALFGLSGQLCRVHGPPPTPRPADGTGLAFWYSYDIVFMPSLRMHVHLTPPPSIVCPSDLATCCFAVLPLAGGHLTHGFYTFSKADNCRKAVSATSVYFESLPYRVHPQTGIIDYEALAAQAALFKPALIIAGGSAYPRDW
jgi:glycine/serine hydroxymethyltransferase